MKINFRLRGTNKAVKPDAIHAMLKDLNSSPFSLNILPSQVPIKPVRLTKSASGPRLPPEATNSKEDNII